MVFAILPIGIREKTERTIAPEFCNGHRNGRPAVRRQGEQTPFWNGPGVEESSVDPWWAGKGSQELKTSIRLQ